MLRLVLLVGIPIGLDVLVAFALAVDGSAESSAERASHPLLAGVESQTSGVGPAITGVERDAGEP